MTKKYLIYSVKYGGYADWFYIYHHNKRKNEEHTRDVESLFLNTSDYDISCNKEITLETIHILTSVYCMSDYDLLIIPCRNAVSWRNKHSKHEGEK